jgi:hypothetical protein
VVSEGTVEVSMTDDDVCCVLLLRLCAMCVPFAETVCSM